MKFSYTKILSLFLILLNIVAAEPAGDLVKNLPDYSYRGRLYSGYLSAGPRKQFHYMFHYANEDYENKPLVLWLNGGPGCSSLDGWSSEHGPMQLDDDGVYHMNEYSWNRAANMLYLESPGGVGFSYIDSQLDYDKEINDDIAAQDNLNALLDFFNKFSGFKGKDFYVSGESYGGIYVPTLAYNIIMHNKGVPESQKINLKGILVGNGVADWNFDVSKARIDFAFSHHLYSYETRLDYNRYCVIDIDKKKCSEISDEMNKNLENINIYDYLRECQLPTTEDGQIDYFSNYFKKAPWAFKDLKQKQENMKKNKPKQDLYIDENEKNESPPCVSDKAMTEYFNREEVKKALHVKTDINWELCSSEVGGRYNILPEGSIWTYPTLLKEGVKVLIYSGDTDFAVPFNGNQAWIHNLKLEIEKPWRRWRAFGDMDNVGGYVINYKGLTFCTVKGTGHMTPQWKPKESYYMFSKFINGEEF